MDVVIVPCFNRPEYLTVWTELVSKADKADEMLYIFCLDYGYDLKYEQVIDAFPFDNAVIRMDRSALQLGKQSRNVLNGMMAGARYAKGKGLVFYIEEDIFIAKDFFRWHREVHRQQKDIFCSIGTKNNNTPWKVDGMPGHYYISDMPDYQALGSCFKPEMILDYIAPHYNNSYLTNPTAYCLRNFPKSIIGSIWTEQDGLIRRIMESNKLYNAFPCVPRGYHAGIYGYNRQPQIMHKSYEEKLQIIREVCFDAGKMKEMLSHMGESYWQDSIPCELDTDFDTLRLVKIDKIKKGGN